MSTLYTDNIESNNAAQITVPTGQTIHVVDGLTHGSMPTGSVIQMVTQKQNTSVNTTNTSFVFSGLSVTITPRFANSQIYIQVLGGSWYAASDHAYTTIYRGSSTNLGEQTSGYNSGLARKNGTNSVHYSPHSMSVVDSPNTTSAVNYQCWFRTESSGSTTYFSYPSYGYVTMTAMEIAG